MAKVAKSVANGKGHNTDQKFFYINVLDIKTEEEQEMLYQKINAIVELYN